MRLKLVLRNNEKDDEFHRRVIERVEFDAGCGPSEGRHDVINPIGRAMRNGDAKADSRAHRFFALLIEARMLSRSSGLILARRASRSISSTEAGQGSVAFIPGVISRVEGQL